ncbi:uncharacterized protein [Amphiura filiformis]|uniref:uncharacterized protein isoform X4 n=1 Tax=Amphiura filiformis TaxID=82378 RepID=UPI003B20CF1B
MTLVWYVYTSLVIPAMVVSQACPPDFCFNGGTCYIDNGIPSCDCLQGYRGPQCGDMVIGPPGGDPCDPSPCQNNGICLVVDDFHVICDCTSTSYGGMYCTENEMLSCQGINPCLNGGRCDVQTDGTYSCDCAGTGYTGETCTENDMLSCQDTNPCLNGGRCDVQTDATYSCDCAGTGYIGDTCADLPDSGRESLAKLSNTTIIVIAVLGVAVGFLIVALCVIACCWYQRRQRRDREQRQQRRDELALRKQCVHRDLATRNILLGEGLVCKVSDFGLARDMAEENEYEMKSRGRVPLRWLALESLLLNVYSSKSDVWSYGVLLWELVTIGSQPYPGMTNGQVISELKKGYRLPKPEHCSEEIYDIMRKCWQENPDERPTFMQIQKEVEHMLEDAQGYLCMSEFNEHDYVYLSDY